MDAFRRKARWSTDATAQRWAVLRAHGGEVVEAIDQLINGLPVSPEERVMVHQTMALLRGILPELQALSEVLPRATGRTGGYKNPKGRPGNKKPRDWAYAKLRDLGVPPEACIRLLGAWGLSTPD